MRKYVDIALPGARVGLRPSTTGLLLQAAFNIETGGCNYWVTGAVRGAHAASLSELSLRERLAYAIEVPACWLLLLLKDARYHIPYTMGGEAVVGTFARVSLIDGIERLRKVSYPKFDAILDKQITPELADEVVQLGMFGRIVFKRRRKKRRP